MKILFLTPQLPYPPHKGTALRNWGLISGLAERHRVSLLSFQSPGQDSQPAPLLIETCARVETVPQPERTIRDRLRDLLFTRQPDMALRLASESFARRLENWLARESFDVVHIEGIELAPYLDVIEAAQPRPLVLFDDHNCEYLLQKRVCLTDMRVPARWPGAAYSFVQWRRLLRYESQICRRADRVLAVSDPDAAELRALSPGLDVTVVPNGIDTHVYQPLIPNPKSQTLVFTGTMDFRPNVDAVLWFARQVLPLVRAEVGEARLVVVGQRPHPRLDELRAAPAITLTGWVEDTRPYIAEAAVYVAPLRMGGGTRLKLLEAMAMGRPVVATRLGAEGFPVTHGREMLLADTPFDFAAEVVGLLRAPEQGAELGRAGRAFVEERYDWRVIVPKVEAVYARRT
ncbi:MAG: glycosyl transferase family 1 [Chloroflexi bacterium]|nr:MAG: glycosyl transferase family 1 [Chloroflexota bacterium]